MSKNHIDTLQNRNVIPGDDRNKSMDQSYLQKKGVRNLHPLKKMKKKPGKTIIIDLTKDDEISVPYKVKRKKTKQRLKYLKIMKKKHKLQKHISTPKNSSRFTDAGIQANSNNNSKTFNDKVRLECKRTISDNKASNSTESCGSINKKSSLNDTNCIDLQKNEHINITKSPVSNVCSDFVKEDEMQHDYNSRYSKTPKLVDQNIKEFKVTANLSRENKMENHVLSHVTYASGNAIDSYSNLIMQGKETLTSQEDSTMEAMPLFKTCQSSIVDQHPFKQELPTSTNCIAMQKLHKCCYPVPVDMNDIKHLIIQLKSINYHSSQITEIIKQKVRHQVNECPNCCTKIDCKPFVFTSNNVVAAKAQDTSYNTFNQNGNDVKSACDTNIIYMLNERNKCVDVVNHIGEQVVTAHAEKEMQCLEKSNNMCTVSTTFVGDKIVESPFYSQHVDLDNTRTNYYGNAIKYSEITMKEQQKRNNCDMSISNDQIHSSESCMFDINPFEIGSNAEIDYETQLKADEINEITKTLDCIDDMENISFLNNIQNETLEDLFRQSSAISLINYDNTTGEPTKKPLVRTDNDVIAMKTHDTLHNIIAYSAITRTTLN